MRLHFLALALLPALAYADGPGTVISEVLTTSTTAAGQPINVPANAKVRVSHYEIAPGAALPIHKHPFPRYGYVEAGEIDVTLVDQKKTIHYKPGDFFAEIIDGWHYGTNTGTMPVKLLVIDQMPETAASNTVIQPKP